MPPILTKRFDFKCWNCHRQYSLLRTVEGQPELYVECPYCYAKGVVDLSPYPRPVTVLKGGGPVPEGEPATWEFPAVLPTTPPNK